MGGGGIFVTRKIFIMSVIKEADQKKRLMAQTRSSL